MSKADQIRYWNEKTEEAEREEVGRDLLQHIQRQREAGSHSRLADLLRGEAADTEQEEA